jgi:hypothetical protein
MQDLEIKKISGAISFNALIDCARWIIPSAPRPEESKVRYIVRECFLLLGKLACASAIIYGTLLLANGGMPSLAVVTAIFLGIFSQKMAFCLNKRISQVTCLAIRGVAIMMGGLGLYELGLPIVIQLSLSASLVVLFKQFSAKQAADDMQIKENQAQASEGVETKEKEEHALQATVEIEIEESEIKGTQEQIFAKIQKIKDDNREKKHLSIRVVSSDQDAQIKAIELILSELSPNTIEFSYPDNLQILNLLNMPRRQNQEYYFYQTRPHPSSTQSEGDISLGYVVKKPIDKKYRVGIGQELSSRFILKCLQALDPSQPIKTIVIRQPEGKEFVRIATEVLQKVKKLNPQDTAWYNCIFPRKAFSRFLKTYSELH